MPDTPYVSDSQEYSDTEIELKSLSDMLSIEKKFKELRAKNPHFDKKISEMEIIAGELGENILKHCGQGKLIIQYHASGCPHIEMISENVGSLPPNAKIDGVSTANTLGLGLGIVSRLSDIVTYEQIGPLLRIRTVKYCEDFPSRSELAVLSYPVSMRDNANGDGFVIVKNQSDFFAVIDALGHGEEAYVSASSVKQFITENAQLSPDQIIYETHRFIQERRVRGVALSIVRVDYADQKVLYCGLGDVMAKIFLPESDETIYPLPKEGIVGDIARNLEVQRFPLVKGSIIAIFSDGVSSRMMLPQAQRVLRPVQLVNTLMNQYGRAHDDRTLLLAKLL